MLDISLPTLRRRYRPELSRGLEQVRATIGLALLMAAISGNVHAMKYWLMTRGGPGWRIVERLQIGTLHDEPAPVLELAPAALPDYDAGEG